jgi:hypothetical protein
MQGKTTYIRPKVVGPFPDPVQEGAMCTRLPFKVVFDTGANIDLVL